MNRKKFITSLLVGVGSVAVAGGVGAMHLADHFAVMAV